MSSIGREAIQDHERGETVALAQTEQGNEDAQEKVETFEEGEAFVRERCPKFSKLTVLIWRTNR